MYSTTFRPPMVSATRPAEPESAHRIRARTRGVPAWAVSEEGEDGVFTDRRTVSSYDATFGSGQPRTDPGEDPALGSAAVASLYCTSIVKDRWLDAVASYLDAISPEVCRKSGVCVCVCVCVCVSVCVCVCVPGE